MKRNEVTLSLGASRTWPGNRGNKNELIGTAAFATSLLSPVTLSITFFTFLKTIVSTCDLLVVYV